MALQRPKPPAESKADLMNQVLNHLMMKWPHQTDAAVLYLLNYFTAVDLAGIRDNLRKGD